MLCGSDKMCVGVQRVGGSVGAGSVGDAEMSMLLCVTADETFVYVFVVVMMVGTLLLRLRVHAVPLHPSAFG